MFKGGDRTVFVVVDAVDGQWHRHPQSSFLAQCLQCVELLLAFTRSTKRRAVHCCLQTMLRESFPEDLQVSDSSMCKHLVSTP